MLLRILCRESTIGLAIAGLVFWAPLPAASVTPAAELFFRLVALAMLAVTLAQVRGWRRAAVLPVMALAAVAGLGLVQSLYWPTVAVDVVSPQHAQLYRQAAELVEPGKSTPFVPLSLDAAVSRSSAISWFAAAGLLAAILVAGRRARHRRWFLGALVGAALLQICIGLVRLQLASPGGLGAVLLRPEGRLLGAYPNPNSLSFLFEMSLVAVAAWFWWTLKGSDQPGRRLAPLLPLGLWLVVFAAVVLTGSRAGLVAALFATALQGAVLPVIDRGRRSAVAAALVVALGLGTLIALGSHLEIRRYVTVSLFEDNVRSRLMLVTPSLELWRRFPVTGTGLGTFEDAFAMVTPAELSPVLWNRAHNDPLELLVTGGLLGLGLGCLVALALFRPVWRVARHGRSTEERAAGLAAIGALAAAAFHELLDFGLVMPANSLALLVIVGSAAAAGLSRPDERSPD